MTRKIDPEKEEIPSKMDVVTPEGASSRPPEGWPGLEGRSEEDEARFVRGEEDEEPAEVTESQRRLERHVHHHEPE